mmetsp:Transcript_117502/g.379214  ORF Transcript_117502/g.379214 Transcript_117502/m.379214 type:complete len:428 (-) Transcript_117502:87-1370(-)
MVVSSLMLSALSVVAAMDGTRVFDESSLVQSSRTVEQKFADNTGVAMNRVPIENALPQLKGTDGERLLEVVKAEKPVLDRSKLVHKMQKVIMDVARSMKEGGPQEFAKKALLQLKATGLMANITNTAVDMQNKFDASKKASGDAAGGGPWWPELDTVIIGFSGEYQFNFPLNFAAFPFAFMYVPVCTKDCKLYNTDETTGGPTATFCFALAGGVEGGWAAHHGEHHGAHHGHRVVHHGRMKNDAEEEETEQETEEMQEPEEKEMQEPKEEEIQETKKEIQGAEETKKVEDTSEKEPETNEQEDEAVQEKEEQDEGKKAPVVRELSVKEKVKELYEQHVHFSVVLGGGGAYKSNAGPFLELGVKAEQAEVPGLGKLLPDFLGKGGRISAMLKMNINPAKYAKALLFELGTAHHTAVLGVGLAGYSFCA